MSQQCRYTDNGLTVPYITRWTYERQIVPDLVVRTSRKGRWLTYADGDLYDRDHGGALWVRQAVAPGKGSADFSTVHSLRQRRAVSHLLCQVCGMSTLEEDCERQLYLLHAADGRPIQDGELTSAPPVCTTCALEAVEVCPALRKGHVAAWVGHAPTWGVAGVLYDPGTLRPVSSGLVNVPYTSPRIRWTIARREIVSLRHCTPVNLCQLPSTHERSGVAGARREVTL
ncbi:hypothetical protein ACWGCW_31975 [Streptomyces sp. NPDC054933]